MNSRARDSRAMDSRAMRDITSYCEHFLECFGKFLNTFLCMYTHFTISSRLTCIPMALPVPQNGQKVNVVIFFYEKGKVFWSVFQVFIHIFIHVHSFCYL